jgi:PAS domain S-box-containing protein
MCGVIITPLILLPASVIFNLETNLQIIINNAYYLAVLSLFLMIILEARIWFDENINEKVRAVELQNKLLKEEAEKVLMEERSRLNEEKNRLAQQMVEEEKVLNQSLNEEIKRREEITRQLHESREQLQSLLSHLMGAVYRCRFDEHYTMEYFSDQIEYIAGYPPSDFINNSVRSFGSLVHPADNDRIRSIIEETTQTHVHYEMEYRIIHRNGNTVWVSESGKCIFNEEGKVEFLDGIIVDITRRKEAEIAANESNRKYKDLMDFLPQPIFELDIQGNILFINRAGEEFFGITIPEDTTQKVSALDYMVQEDVPRVIENIKKTTQSLIVSPNEYTVKRPDGSLCPVLIYGSPIIQNNQVIGRRGFIIDISERKKYEIGLLHAKQELEQINNNLEQIVAERSRELVETNNQLLKVQKENLQSQFEILRQQINPHFLFNSLNVLSGLISKDTSQAQLFIDEFSHIYRYVLETLEQPVTTLNKELDFMRSYLYLQQMRYGENLTWSVNIHGNLLELVMPPLSLQVVLENALKHNIVNEAKPLAIDIFSEDKMLIIKNRLQPKISKGKSTGLGLKNLVKRYALISDLTPVFTIEDNYYIATLPLINIENDERIDR